MKLAHQKQPIHSHDFYFEINALRTESIKNPRLIESACISGTRKAVFSFPSLGIENARISSASRAASYTTFFLWTVERPISADPFAIESNLSASAPRTGYGQGSKGIRSRYAASRRTVIHKEASQHCSTTNPVKETDSAPTKRSPGFLSSINT